MGELAKPVWDDEGSKARPGEQTLSDYQQGSVEQLDIEQVAQLDEKETFGVWDQSLHLVPALSRSVEPQGRQWVLLARSKEAVEEEEVEENRENRVTRTQLGME